jgi:hypothetical protein
MHPVRASRRFLDELRELGLDRVVPPSDLFVRVPCFAAGRLLSSSQPYFTYTSYVNAAFFGKKRKKFHVSIV